MQICLFRLIPASGLTTAEMGCPVQGHSYASCDVGRGKVSRVQQDKEGPMHAVTTTEVFLLAMLTIVDIRAVGPGVWNGWKAQLMRTLYY